MLAFEKIPTVSLQIEKTPFKIKGKLRAKVAAKR